MWKTVFTCYLESLMPKLSFKAVLKSKLTIPSDIFLRALFYREIIKFVSNYYFWNKKTIRVYRFSINTVFKKKKKRKENYGKLGVLIRFCCVFSSKISTFGHISEISFDCKCINNYRYAYFYNGKSDRVFLFFW